MKQAYLKLQWVCWLWAGVVGVGFRAVTMVQRKLVVKLPAIL